MYFVDYLEQAMMLLRNRETQTDAERERIKTALLPLYLNLSLTELRLDNPPKALKYGNKALEIDSGNTKALFRCGQVRRGILFLFSPLNYQIKFLTGSEEIKRFGFWGREKKGGDIRFIRCSIWASLSDEAWSKLLMAMSFLPGVPGAAWVRERPELPDCCSGQEAVWQWYQRSAEEGGIVSWHTAVD